MARAQVVSGRILTVPNFISMLRLALVPVFAVLIVRGDDVWALTVLAVSGASDWLDGVIARRFDQVSRLGKVLDPAADRLFILVTMVALVWRDVIPLWLVLVLVDARRPARLPHAVPRPAAVRPAPGALRRQGRHLRAALRLPAAAARRVRPGSLGTTAAVLGWAFAGWGAGLYWFAAVVYLVQARALLAPDRVGVGPR